LQKPYVILAAGIVALSTAVVLVKLSQLPVALLASLRLLGGAAILLPFMLRERRVARVPATPMKLVLLAAVLLAAHFITWFVGVRMTSAANATLVVNLSPVVMPFALLAFVGERVTRREVVGSILAVAGVAVLTLGSAKDDDSSFVGDLICVGSMSLAVCYMVLARRNGRGRGIFGYIVPLYAAAGLLSLLYAAASGDFGRLSGDLNWPREIVLVALLALVPTAFGHSVLNYAMTQLRGQVVAVASLGQVVFAALLAVPLLGEVPAWPFYPACGLIAAGAVVAVGLWPGRKT
jgi:drug/metabolite transporter (DMT)-like permease